jgi:hypothetical protein
MAKSVPSTHTSVNSLKEDRLRRDRNKRRREAVTSMRQWHRRMQEGPVFLIDDHPIVGRTYERLNTDELNAFLDEAQIMDEDSRFTTFTLVIGTHGLDKTPFVCVKNHLEDGLHLLLGNFEFMEYLDLLDS